MRKTLVLALLGLGAVATLLVSALASASGGSNNVKAHDGLSGYQEVPALSTTGNGTFEGKVVDNGTAVDWTMSYSALEGNVLQAHIHFAQRSVNGTITVFLCTNLGNGPAGTQPCPPPPATISGTFRGSDMVAGGTAQGLEPGAFGELLAAIRAGKTYANVHSSKWPGGEIRGQLNDPDGKG